MFFRSNATVIRFFIFFVAFLLAGHILLQVTYNHVSPFLVDTLHVGVSAHIVNIISPGEKAVARNGTIVSQNSSLQIAKGCEGIEGILLIVAAVCAFPAGMRKKAFGLLAGVLFIYALNLTRIVGLWFTLRHKPALFDIMHIYVGQTYIIFFCVLFFMWWAVHGKYSP
jgi:exosortase family protein XrtM